MKNSKGTKKKRRELSPAERLESQGWTVVVQPNDNGFLVETTEPRGGPTTWVITHDPFEYLSSLESDWVV